MPTSFRPYDPDQSSFLPPSPRDWLPEHHLCLFVAEAVDSLDPSAFYRRYEGDGRRAQPFDPRMMVKVLVYGYATGVVSSRRIAKKLEEDVAFRYLAAGNFPAHRTIVNSSGDQIPWIQTEPFRAAGRGRSVGPVEDAVRRMIRDDRTTAGPGGRLSAGEVGDGVVAGSPARRAPGILPPTDGRTSGCERGWSA